MILYQLTNMGYPNQYQKKIIHPDVLIIPLVAFDNELNRLGYGGGYYDRYIAKSFKKKRIIKIGIAYSFQKLNKIPINKYDIRLDYIITEEKFYK